ncbi:MAG: FAD-dependent oxidoreductase [Thermosphaera sp.]
MADYLKFAFTCKDKPASNNLKVGIIGAGPAGLAAAGYLACQGYEITIYDKQPYPGGLMLFAIPPWRIPRHRVILGTKELEEKYGVKFELRTKVFSGEAKHHEEGDEFVEKKVGLEEIVNNYDLVLITTGTWVSKIPKLPGANAKGVVSALEYVYKFRLYELKLLERKPHAGNKVVVIGGGYSAIDAAEQALREGAESYLLYRRTINEAPAGIFEIERIQRMGVEFMELVSPVEIIVENGGAKAIKMQKMKLGPLDETGRPQPVPIEGSEFLIEADTIVFATGETATPPLASVEEYMAKLGIKLSRNNTIIVNDKLQTGNPKVFAAGDVVNGPTKVGKAISSGLYAAKYMNARIQAKLLKQPLAR